MRDGVDAHVGTYEHSVADIYGCFIEDGKVVIAYEIVADADVFAEIASERAVYGEIFTDMSEH